MERELRRIRIRLLPLDKIRIRIQKLFFCTRKNDMSIRNKRIYFVYSILYNGKRTMHV